MNSTPPPICLRHLALAVLVALCPAAGKAAVPSAPAGPPVKPAPREGTWKPTESSPARRALGYVPSRVADFLDMWRLNVGVGLGIAANLRPTKAMQIGLGAYDSTRFGLRGRRFPFWHEWSLEGGVDGMYEEMGDTERGFYEFGFTAHFILVGLELSFDIEEALDFLCGLAMQDPADDDFR